MTKRHIDYCRIFVFGSVVWFFVIVFCMVYFLDTSTNELVYGKDKHLIIDDSNPHGEIVIKDKMLDKRINPKFPDNKNSAKDSVKELPKTRRTETGPSNGILDKLMRGIIQYVPSFCAWYTMNCIYKHIIYVAVMICCRRVGALFKC